MKPILILSALAAMLGGGTASGAAITPVDANGRLAVVGSNLVNQRGETVQLRGFASHGMQWFNSFYADGAAFEAAADLWGGDVLRLTIYLSEDGYLTSKTIDKEQFEAWIERYVRVCVQKGIYIILDWHVHKPGYPAYYLKEAKEFFQAMSLKYGNLPNVIWEIANEPSNAPLTDLQSGGTGTDPGHYVEWREMREYADAIIPIIRKNSPQGIVLVGTPSWSTLGVSTRGTEAWKEIADNKLAYSNVMYVIHYYAAAHTFQDAFEKASERLPLFATEWAASGFQETSSLDVGKGKAYADMMDRRKISWAYWNYSDNTPGVFAVFDSTTKSTGPFEPTGANVTPTGRAVYRWMNEPADSWTGSTGISLHREAAPARSDLRTLVLHRKSGRMLLKSGGDGAGSWHQLDGRRENTWRIRGD